MNEIIKKNGTTFGIISGIISILLTTVIYIVNVEYFVSIWAGLIGLAFSITIACVLLSKTKKEIKKDFTFKEAFTTYFLMAIIGILISTAFSILLFNFIDPSLKETIKELTLKSVSSMMQKFGGKTADVNKALKQIQETDQFSIISQLKGIFTSIVVTSIFGLILAAFFKTPTRNEI